MANIQNDNFLLKGKKTLDARRLRLDGTPWTSISEVLMAFIQEDRVESQVYFIVDREYWFLGGTNNIHLVEKKTGTEYVDSSTIHFEPTTASVKDNSITPAKLQPINNNTFLGNNVGSTTNPKALTVSEAKTMLGVDTLESTVAGKQATLTDVNFGAFTSSVGNKAIQIGDDIIGYIDSVTGKWVKQTFTNLIAFLKGFFQPKIKVIYIGSDETLSATHDGCVLIVTAFVVLTIPSGLGATFTSCVIDVKVGQCTIGTAGGVTATGYYSLILSTGDTTSIIKETDGTNNFRIK